MTVDQFTVRSFYLKAIDEYLDAVDQFTDLYDKERVPGKHEMAAAEALLRHAFEKVETVYTLAWHNHGIQLDEIPQFLSIGGTA